MQAKDIRRAVVISARVEEEIAQLRRIRRLQQELGINLAGVEVILHLLERLESTRRELELERSAGNHAEF